jgi:hypothetical protein
MDLKEVKAPTSSECISQYAKIGFLQLAEESYPPNEDSLPCKKRALTIW